MESFLEVLRKMYPAMFLKWDGWDYSILSPCSLDDSFSILLTLKWKNGTARRFQIDLNIKGVSNV